MIKLNQAVIVEGKYDKIKLSSLLDAVIITTDGFGIYKDKEKTELLFISNEGSVAQKQSLRFHYIESLFEIPLTDKNQKSSNNKLICMQIK